jgi:hypothetical protein
MGADDFGESNLTYTWTASGTPPAPVNFSANGTNSAKNTTATFSKAGTYSLFVTLKDAGNLTTTSSVNVTVNQTVTSITVAPPSATVVNNNSQQFSAAAIDQFGDPVLPAPTFTWSLDSPSVGSVDSVGFYSAPASSIGPAVVRAAAGATSGAANVNVVWLKGDIDGDGQRTVKDMFAMMSALGDLTTYQTNRNLSPTDLTTIADIDNDTAVTNLDLQALVNLLAADAAGGGSAGAISSASISPLRSVATPTVPSALGGVPGAATESTTASLPLAPRDGSQERNAEISNLESGIAVHAVPSTPYSGLPATAVVRELPALAERPFYPPIRSSLDPLTPISLSARDYIYANIETPTNSRRFIHRSRTPDSADDLVGFPLCPKGEREGL